MGLIARLSLTIKVILASWAVPVLAMAALALYLLLPGADPAHIPAHAPILIPMLGILGAAFLAGVILIHITTHRFTRSVRTMARAAEAIGQGAYQQRIDFYPGKELEQLAGSINWMAERIGQHVGVITEQKEKLQAVLDTMWDGVMVLNRKGCIQSVNRALTGIAPGAGDMLGKRPLEVLGSSELQDICDHLLANGAKTSDSVVLTLGERVWEVNAVLPADQAQGLGLILVFHDISEMKRAEAVRRDFAANVSHELRTPLTSIKGYAETLLTGEPPPPETLLRFLGIILRNADHMSKMINDLLSLSRLEARDARTDLVPVNPREALAVAWEAVESMATEKEVRLVDELGDDPPRVLADHNQLVQIFRNLLENAVKFTSPGRPVHVSATAGPDQVCISVRDLGPGIPRKDQPRIFERFYSVEKHRSNKYGSTGLGLAICRHIVRNLNGEISVQSPPQGFDTGTAFLFSLPMPGPDRQHAFPIFSQGLASTRPEG